MWGKARPVKKKTDQPSADKVAQPNEEQKNFVLSQIMLAGFLKDVTDFAGKKIEAVMANSEKSSGKEGGANNFIVNT